MLSRHDGRGSEKSAGKGAQIIDYDLAKCREILSDLHARISEYATSDRFYEEYELAIYEYFEQRDVCVEGEEAPDEFFRDEEEFERFMAWYALYFITDGHNQTFPSLFRRMNRYQLSPFEGEILKNYENSCLSLYEVQQVESGRGFLLKDLFDGRSYQVQDSLMSRALCKWDVVYTGLVTGRGLTFPGGFESIVIPPQLRNFIQKKIVGMFENEREEYGILEEFLRINSAEVSAVVEKALEDYCEEPPRNNEGDILCLATLHYRITDPLAFAGKIGESPFFSLESSPAAGKASYTWIRQPKEGLKIYDTPPLGVLKIEKNRLRAECNSRERAKRLRGVLEGAFAPFLRYMTMICEDPEMRIPFRDGLSDGDSGFPREDSFESWLDSENPSLNDMTPREAAATQWGRERLVDLLKEMENENERMLRLCLKSNGHSAFPVDRIMKELGL